MGSPSNFMGYMAIARQIVEAHGDTIGVGAGPPGAEIILVLPRSQS